MFSLSNVSGLPVVYSPEFLSFCQGQALDPDAKIVQKFWLDTRHLVCGPSDLNGAAPSGDPVVPGPRVHILKPSHICPFALQFLEPSGWWSHGVHGSDRLSFRVRDAYRA